MNLVSTKTVLLQAVFRLLACTLFALMTLGCHRLPEGRSSVDQVTVRGNEAGDKAEERIATAPSPKFLGIKRGFFYEYSTFDRFQLQQDLARLEAYYRSLGYYEAHVRAGRVFTKSDDHVRVEILVDEGEPVLNTTPTIEDQGSDRSLLVAARTAVFGALPLDKPFEQEKLDAAKERLRKAYARRGYAYAKVEGSADVDLVTHRAHATFKVDIGPRCTYGPITIEGLGKLPITPVRRALDLKAGDRFDGQELEEAQQAAIDLGVFSSVDIRPQLTEDQQTVVPIKIVVEPSRLKQVRLGGGAEFDALKTDVHAILGWEHRNFFGGLRSFSATFRPGLVFYPLRTSNLAAPTDLFFEEKLRLDFRQPGFFEARTAAFVRPQFNVFPLLLNPNPRPEAPVLGYAEFINSVGVERTFFRHFYVALSHNVQVDSPIGYKGEVDESVRTIVALYPELSVQVDFRDDRRRPTKGFYLGNIAQMAGGPFGGKVRDFKVQPEARVYVPLGKRLVWATRATLGFLLPQNYGKAIENIGNDSFSQSKAESTRDYQVTFFRGFFSGGPSSNRGYPLRGVSPYDYVEFLLPSAAEANAARGGNELVGQACIDAGGREANDGSCIFASPTGGFSMWEASTELRWSVAPPLALAGFCDLGDVSPRVMSLRFTHLHLSCGLGVRYDTPVGPIRADLGYRVPGMQVLGGLTPDQRAPQTFPLDLPLAVSIGIGETF